MISNPLGTALLNGTTTLASFGGLPLIGCLDDYSTALLYQPFLDFATDLGVPAIVTDEAHDGLAPTALIAALKAYSKFFTGFPLVGPFYGPSGLQPVALIGAIFTLSSSNVRSGVAKSVAVAAATRNFTRNNLLGYGVNAISLHVGEDLDITQRPPIYLDRFTVFGSGGVTLGQSYNGTDTAYSSGRYRSMQYWQILAAVWSGGNWTLGQSQNLWQSLPTTAQLVLTAGLSALAGAPTRFFLPSLLPLLLLFDYRGGGVFSSSSSLATWTAGGAGAIGVYRDDVPFIVPCDGIITNLSVQGFANVGAPSVATVYRTPAFRPSAFAPIYGATALTASITVASGIGHGVVALNKGDLLFVEIDTSWANGGTTLSIQFLPKLTTLLGQEIG